MVRFSWVRPDGWIKLGVTGAVAVLFGTPMLWALGSFGQQDDARTRAIIFAAAGIWLFVAVGYCVGWAIRGFLIKNKEASDDEGDAMAPHRPPQLAVRPSAPPPPQQPRRPPPGRG